MNVKNLSLSRAVLTVIAVCLLLTFGVVGVMAAANPFVIVRTYTEGQFPDVKKTDWFATEVQKAYEIGLIDGKSAAGFEPGKNLTIGEAVKLAAVLNQIYTKDTTVFESATPWYKPYVDYSLAKGILSKEYSDYNAFITRAQFADIFAKALPKDALVEKNKIEDGTIPDVTTSEAVYTLYRAGVLTGSDKDGNFKPNTNILRSEVAVIVSRMAFSELRKEVILAKKEETGEISGYKEYSMIPDFGAFSGVPLYHSEIDPSKDAGLTGIMYTYELKLIEDGVLNNYIDLLAEEGFKPIWFAGSEFAYCNEKYPNLMFTMMIDSGGLYLFIDDNLKTDPVSTVKYMQEEKDLPDFATVNDAKLFKTEKEDSINLYAFGVEGSLFSQLFGREYIAYARQLFEAGFTFEGMSNDEYMAVWNSPSKDYQLAMYIDQGYFIVLVEHNSK